MGSRRAPGSGEDGLRPEGEMETHTPGPLYAACIRGPSPNCSVTGALPAN